MGGYMEEDAWRRKILERIERLDVDTLQLVYFFIVGLENRRKRKK